MEKERGKSVGIWIRVSTEDQAKGDSPEHHEKRARCYAESKDWNVVEVYHLEAVSGKAVMAHPEAQRMLKDIKRGHMTGLIFSKLGKLLDGKNPKPGEKRAHLTDSPNRGNVTPQFKGVGTTPPLRAVNRASKCCSLGSPEP